MNTEQIVKDLNWICSTPQYLKDSQFQLPLEILSSPNVAAVNFESLKPSKKLGWYYEQLIELLIKSNPNITEYRSNVQVQGDERTLGEFDFLLNHHCYGWIHLEVAIKFYLAFSVNGKTAFIGPNAKDKLSFKLDRLLNCQLLLSDREEADEILEKNNITELTKYYLMQGWVFVNPLLTDQLDLSLINSEVSKGIWIYQNQLKQLKIDSDERIFQVPKLQWISRYEEIIESDELQLTHLPVLLVIAFYDIKTNKWLESKRVMVVDNKWPKV